MEGGEGGGWEKKDGGGNVLTSFKVWRPSLTDIEGGGRWGWRLERGVGYVEAK